MTKISIIITSFNSAKFLSLSINSVLNQSYLDFELIIIDDASKDNTQNIISKFEKKDKRIKKFFFKKNSGTASIPRNMGAKLARGEYLCFLDADDIWLSNKLEKQIKGIKKNTNLSFTSCIYINKDGKKYSSYLQGYFRKIIQHFFFKKGVVGLFAYNFVILSSVLIKKKIFKSFLFDTSKSIVGVEDLDLWLKILYIIPKNSIVFCDQELVKIRRTPNSLNINYTQASLRNTYCVIKFFLEKKIYKNFQFFLFGIILRTIKSFIKLSQKTFKKNFLRLSFIIVSSYLVIFYSPLFWYLGNNLVHYDKPEITKHLVILTGNSNDTYINLSYQRRYLDTKILLKDNSFDKIFIMGREQEIEENEIIRSLLSYDGIKKENIYLIENTFGNTKENIAELNKVLTSYGVNETNFLTSPYHTKRSKLLWKKYLPNMKIHISSNINAPSAKIRWSYNYNEIKIIIYENFAIVYNRLRGWL